MDSNSTAITKFGSPVLTEDGSYTIFIPEIQECYHSTAGASLEANSLYVSSSEIQKKFEDIEKANINVLDVGLGLAYNAIATIECWAAFSKGANLELGSLEYNKDLIDSIMIGDAPWQINWPTKSLAYCRSLKKISDNSWQAEISHPNTDAKCIWKIYLGDASKTEIPKPSQGEWDFVWQDPFSPKKNPEMWSSEWFGKLKPACNSETTLLTYSCSRPVKDGLDHGGWNWKLIKACGKKRNWLQAEIVDPSL